MLDVIAGADVRSPFGLLNELETAGVCSTGRSSELPAAATQVMLRQVVLRAANAGLVALLWFMQMKCPSIRRQS